MEFIYKKSYLQNSIGLLSSIGNRKSSSIPLSRNFTIGGVLESGKLDFWQFRGLWM